MRGENVVKVIRIVLIICLLFSGCGFAYAEVDISGDLLNSQDFSQYTFIESLSSSLNQSGEYFRVKTPFNEDNTLYVEGRVLGSAKLLCITLKTCDSDYDTALRVFVKPNSEGEFSICVNTEEGNKTDAEILDGKGDVIKKPDTYDAIPGYKAVPKMENEFYRIVVTRADTEADANVGAGANWWKGPLGGDYGYIWNDAVLSPMDENNLKLIQFDTVIEDREVLCAKIEKDETTIDSYKGAYERYLDADLSDISYVLSSSGEAKIECLSDAEIAYIKQVSEQVTSDALNDYEKIQRIYEYVASNFYYDYFAWENKAYQYCNPYKNLYTLNNGGSMPNASGKQVGTVCDGFAALVISMARAEGIPARMVNGINLKNSKTWKNLSSDSVTNHWWSEVYVDGRWIMVDANRGTLNSWKRDSASDMGTWIKQSYISYDGFDITKQAQANTYLLKEILAGSNEKEYLCYKNEIAQLKDFLNFSYNQVSNGKKLNPLYDEEKLSTWGTDVNREFYGDGKGRTYQILWENEDLYGTVDFRNFTNLRFVNLSVNELEEIKVEGCHNLKYLSAVGNNLSSFDSSESPALETIRLKNNKLTSAKFIHNGKEISITGVNGTFSLYYERSENPSLTIFVGKANEGTGYAGIYDGKGNLLSTEQEFKLEPNKTSYVVKYTSEAKVLSVPKNMKISNVVSSGKPKVTWDKVDGADKYYVYRSIGVDGNYERISTTTSTSYTHSGAKAGKIYYYKVKAVKTSNEKLNSAYSSTVSKTCDLAQPTNLKVTNIASSGKPKITWDAVEGAKKYYVYRATSSSSTFEVVGTVTEPSFIHSGAKAGKTYYYKVKAVHADNENANSAQSGYISRVCDLARPTNLKISNVTSSGKPKVTWDVVAGADKYFVYRATSSSGSYEKIATTASNTFIHTGAKVGKTYYYRVKAIDADNENASSAWTGYASKTCDLAQPTNLKVTNIASSGKPKITWDAVEGAKKYYVYRATSSSGTFEVVGTVTEPSFIHSGAKAGKTYYYKVKAVHADNENANSAYSSAVSATTK